LSIYVDSSFLVAVYLSDIHTPTALRRITKHPAIWFTPFHEVELVHAIAQNVFRGQILPEVAERIYAEIEKDCRAAVWHLVGLPDTAYGTAAKLARIHVPQVGSRTLDTLHVAAALELGAKEFWTFDDRQKKLAKAVGLKAS
jgi:predicted nucleic acid-binding protein